MAQEESGAVQVLERASVVFVNGPPRSGKDTFCKHLQAMLSVNSAAKHNGLIPIPMKFAEPIKSSVATTFNLTAQQAYNNFETEKKDQISPRFYGKTPREVLISFSEHWLKPAFGNNIFGRLALHRMVHKATSFPAAVFIFPDSGFQSEFDVIYDDFHKCGNPAVYGVHMYREGCTFDGDSRSYIDFRGAVQYTVQNDGTEEHLRSIASQIATAIIAGHALHK